MRLRHHVLLSAPDRTTHRSRPCAAPTPTRSSRRAGDRRGIASCLVTSADFDAVSAARSAQLLRASVRISLVSLGVILLASGCSGSGSQGGTKPLDVQGLDGVTDSAGVEVDADTVQGPGADGTTTDAPVGDADSVSGADADAFDPSRGPVGEPCGPDLPDCPAERRVCESVYHVCVECEVEWGARGYYGHGCAIDAYNAYCGQDWRCHPATRCYLDLDCKSSPSGSHCNLQTYRCAQCGTDWDCSDNERCQGGTCVPATRCADHHDCAAPTPTCDPITRRCVGCVRTSIYTDQCVDAATRCIDRECVHLDVAVERPCTASSDCFDLGVDCDVAAGRCRPCTSDDDCPEKRYCHVGTGQCLRDVCQPDMKRCGAWCMDAPIPGTSCPLDANPDFEVGVGAVQRCSNNGDGWESPSQWICSAGEQCVDDDDQGVQCKPWHVCEPGEAFCDGYESHAVCQDDFTLAWSECGEPRVCGAGGQCILP